MDLLVPYRQNWFVTITPYGRDIEPNVPDKEQVVDTFLALSEIVGPDRMCWRYDPIFIDEEWTFGRHIEAFTAMCRRLEGAAHTVVISFIDLYEKVKRNFPEARTVPFDVQVAMTREMVSIAAAHGLTVKPCGEDPRLAEAGADCSGCMTKAVFEKAIGRSMILPPNPKNRDTCACYITGDIGEYNTCGHFCRYCYANSDRQAVLQAMKLHDPESPLLIGRLRPEDRIREAKQVSYIDPQLHLDLLY